VTGRAGSSSRHLRLARLPIHFFCLAVGFFLLGVIALPFVVGDLLTFFYQPLPLALTHAFTLGWISAAIMGVMYRYVPAVTKRPLRFPRLALAQLWLFGVGVLGMVAHFAIGRWVATWLAAAVVVLSVLLFAVNMVCCLAPRVGRGVAETGTFLAVLYLVAAATLGWLLALDRTFGFLGGSVLTNLAAHAHLAAIGWVGLTICAVSYRMLPAFLLPDMELPKSAQWQLVVLAVSVGGLAAALMGQVGGTAVWGSGVAAALLWYVVVVVILARNRRMPMNWTMRHALASLVHLGLAAAFGVSLLLVDPGGALGNRVAGTYGVVGMLGWVTNIIVGMSYQLFPGFIAGLRVTADWPRLTAEEMAPRTSQPCVFAFLNAGVLVLAGGLLAAQAAVAFVGALGLAIGGLAYVAGIARTLSFAYRRGVSSSTQNPLRVLPG
jgi:hypothetical protein